MLYRCGGNWLLNGNASTKQLKTGGNEKSWWETNKIRKIIKQTGKHEFKFPPKWEKIVEIPP